MSKYNIFLSKAAQLTLAKLRKADMVTRKGGRSMVWLLKTAIVPLAARSRASDVRVILSFVKFCSRMARRSGVKYLVLYLKAAQVLLQQAYGGQVLPSTRPLKAAVARSRSGLPSLIPREHRLLIKAGSRRELRLWMTLLGLYRVLGFVGVLKTDTITAPGKTIPGDAIVGFQRFIHDRFFQMASGVWGFTPLLHQAIMRNAKGKIALWTEFASSLKATQFEIPKSSPTAGLKWHGSTVSTATESLEVSAVKWGYPMNEPVARAFDQWCRNTGNYWLVEFIQAKFDSFIVSHPMRSSPLPVWSDTELGRLALKEEAAGKIRVFAMVDAFTQWALYPLHMRIMSTLSTWRQDGTFDQWAPVKALLAESPAGLWSFDLSAATDRLPLQFQKIVLQPILGIHGAETWGDILVKRGYNLRNQTLHYEVGQPMGAYSSWAMLALTHHALVQWAWYRVCIRHQRPYTWFKLYAILGDDVVIGEAEVAAEYLEVMATLGVEVGLAKSLISPNRLVGEFAKRFFVPREASMIPIREVVAARFNLQELLQFARKYRLTVTQLLSIAGVGYRVKGSLNKRFRELGNRTGNLLLIALHPSSPLGVGLGTWLQSIGWGRLGEQLSADVISRWLEDEFNRLLALVKTRRATEGKTVWQMMMVKRDHGNRYNPYDHLYDRYDAVLKKLDGYTYEISEIEKLLQLQVTVRHGLEGYYILQDCERRLAALPKPGDFESRASVERPKFDSLKLVRLWRNARAAEQSWRSLVKGNK